MSSEDEKKLRAAFKTVAEAGKNATEEQLNAFTWDALLALGPLLAELEQLRDLVGKLTWCRTCGKPVEPERYCYAILTCYACLPPPSLPLLNREPGDR